MFRKVLPVLAGLVILALVAGRLWPEPAYAPVTLEPAYLQKAAEWKTAHFPEMPEDWHWQNFSLSGGAYLRTGHSAPGDPKGEIILVPGYAMSSGMYGHIVQGLLARNYAVTTVDLRGQGGSSRMLSNPEKQFVPEFSVYADDLATFIASRRKSTGVPLIVMGESFGGHVSLRALSSHETGADGLLLVAPALQIKTPPYPGWFARGLVETSRLAGLSDRYAVGQSDWVPYAPDFRDETPCASYAPLQHVKDVQFAAHPEIRVGGPTNQWIAGIMKSGGWLQAKGRLKTLGQPVTIIAAGEDYYVRNDISANLCARSLADCQLVTLAEKRHCLLFEGPQTETRILDELDRLYSRFPER